MGDEHEFTVEQLAVLLRDALIALEHLVVLVGALNRSLASDVFLSDAQIHHTEKSLQAVAMMLAGIRDKLPAGPDVMPPLS